MHVEALLMLHKRFRLSLSGFFYFYLMASNFFRTVTFEDTTRIMSEMYLQMSIKRICLPSIHFNNLHVLQ